MKLTKLAILVLMLAFAATSAKSQTFKADYSTKLVLAGGGTDLVNTMTITSTAGGIAPIALMFPNAYATAGYILSSDATGHLSWVNPGTQSLTLADGKIFVGNGSNVAAPVSLSQDVTITDAGVATVNGSHAATFAATGAITAGGNISTATGTVSGATGTFTNLSGTTMTGPLAMGTNNITGTGTISTTGAVDGGTGVFTSTLSAVGLTSTGGLSTSGGAANLSTTDASAVNIGTGAFANTIDIGNALSTTNFLGTVNLPPGSVSAGSMALTTNDLMVGVAGKGSALATANNGVLVTDGSGVPSISSTLPSAVQGNITSVGALTSGSIGSGFTAIPNTALASSSLTVASGSGLSGGGSVSLGGTTTLTINDGYANIWTTSQTFNSGIASSGSNDLALTSPASHAIDLNNTNANAVNIGAGASEANAIDIGNGTAPLSGSYSTTTFGGQVNFTGAVSLPAGSVSPSSIPLADGKILVGNSASPNVAAPVFLSQDVTITDAGVATVQGSHAATTFAVVNAETVGGTLGVTGEGSFTAATGTGLAVTSNATVGGTLGVTGQTTLGSTALSKASAVSVTSATLTLNTTSSYFPLSSSAPESVTSIAGANATAGQVIVLMNTNSVAANTITLTSGAGLALNGSSVIMGDGGSVTLMYDGTTWHLIGAE